MRRLLRQLSFIPLLFALAGLHTRHHSSDTDPPGTPGGRRTPLPGRGHASDSAETKSRIDAARVGGTRPSTTGTPPPADPGAAPPGRPNQAAIDQAFNDLPAFTRTGTDADGNPTLQSPTSGYLLNGDNRVQNPYDGSGGDRFDSRGQRQPPAPEVQETVRDSPSEHPRGYSQLGNRADVEMKAAYLARTEGEGGENLDLVINNPDGPCPMCRDTLPYVLRPDQTMTVHWTDQNGVAQSTPFTGIDW
jgi:hypothetical protein